jgi:hypothetical protein
MRILQKSISGKRGRWNFGTNELFTFVSFDKIVFVYGGCCLQLPYLLN